MIFKEFIDTMVDNIIFLDIDGVLTSKDYNSFIFDCKPEDYKINKYHVDVVKGILNSCDNTYIVLSTTWRTYPLDHYFIGSDNGYRYDSPLSSVIDTFKDHIIGSAPHSRHCKKKYDICDWLQKYDYSGNFVILDDDPMQDLSYFSERWFRTTRQHGLTVEIGKQIIRYLNKEQ